MNSRQWPMVFILKLSDFPKTSLREDFVKSPNKKSGTGPIDTAPHYFITGINNKYKKKFEEGKEKKNLRFEVIEPIKPLDFERNQNRSALSKKERPNKEENRKNFNRSNTYGFWANNLVLFS